MREEDEDFAAHRPQDACRTQCLSHHSKAYANPGTLHSMRNEGDQKQSLCFTNAEGETQIGAADCARCLYPEKAKITLHLSSQTPTSARHIQTVTIST